MKLMTLFTTKKKETSKPHYGDVARWIERVIDSCETQKQIKSAERLIRLFESQYYGDLTFSEMNSTSRSLLRRCVEKWGDILEEKLEKKDKKKKDKKK
jgi:hypothetical protein